MARIAPTPVVYAPRARRARWFVRLARLGLLLAIAPLVWDGLQICAANWMAMHDQEIAIKTHALDAVTACQRAFMRQCWEVARPILRDPPWKAGSTILITAAWAIAMAWIFRTRPSR
jgi:hypothetical protein